MFNWMQERANPLQRPGQINEEPATADLLFILNTWHELDTQVDVSR